MKQTFRMFSCRTIGSDVSLLYLIADFEESCYVGRHLYYALLVGLSQILLYAIGLPLLVFLFLRRHRSELDKPVVKFRYGLFFSGFRKETYYWECVVALRKISTVILAVFGPQMGVEMLAHVALLVFMVQMLVQLIGAPYEKRHFKLQILDVSAIVICWGTMWSGFFFMAPRPPNQKQALIFLTMVVVVVNCIFMAVLLYSMCSQYCREHETSTVVRSFRRKTESMGHVMHLRTTHQKNDRKKRRATRHVINPHAGREIEMNTISRPETLLVLGKTSSVAVDQDATKSKTSSVMVDRDATRSNRAMKGKRRTIQRPKMLSESGNKIETLNEAQLNRKIKLKFIQQRKLRLASISYKTNPLLEKKSELVSSTPSKLFVKAAYDYVAADDDELSMAAGDIITILEAIDDDWGVGMNGRTGEKGLYPLNYVH